MERVPQLLRDGRTTMNAAGSELCNNNSLDDNFSALLNGKLELMVIGIVERTILPFIEPLIRRTVKEEIDVALEKVLPSMNMKSTNEASTSQSRSLQLQFLNKISPAVWTGRKIEGEGNTPIEVALVDTSTGKIVSSGPEADAKVEIVVVEGDCEGEEFSCKIVRERKGKKLLRGNNYVNLKEGIGSIGEIIFAHNSEWMKNHKFRLGARVVDAVFGTIIKDAKTEPFIVKDRRTTLKGKNHPPLASDEVWRLENIHKHGAYHDRLRTANINTVKDFLTLLSENPERLQKILRVGADAKVWKVMVDHAQTCVIDDHAHPRNSSQQSLSDSNCRTPPPSSDHAQPNQSPIQSLSYSNCRTPHDHAQLMNPSQSPHQSLSVSNCWTHPLINDHAEPSSSSQLLTQKSLRDVNSRTLPLNNDHDQPRSSSEVAGGGTNSLYIYEPNYKDIIARHFGTCHSPDWDTGEDLLQSYICDHNLQSEIPNIKMHYEQQGSTGSMLVMTSQSLLIDRTQKFWPQMAKLLRRASIRRRIDAIEPERVHFQKRQRLF